MAASQLSYHRVFKKIQSSFPKYIENKNEKMLFEIFDSKVSDTVKCFVEAAFRHFLIGVLNAKGPANLADIKLIVKICIEGARQEACHPNLPILILSDAFDCITINQCEELFEFVESIVAVLKEPLFFSFCKNQVLRMCNDVLRRLSRTQNTIFCGRILLFLARFFPFSERSGLNLTSEFNLENVTAYSAAETNEGDEKMIEEEKTSKNQHSPDFTLYTKFWALQDFFRNPIQCFQHGPWETYTKYADDVLEAFGSFKLDPVQVQKKEDDDEDDIAKDSDDQISEFFPKYLTSQKLLDLQFSDSNFRRYILVQMLIHGQYLTSDIKFKQDRLNEEQKRWVRQMQEKAHTLIAETPSNGKQFSNIVRYILKKESTWSSWKNRGCPENKLPLKSDKLNQAPQQNGKDEKMDESENKSSKVREKRKIGDIIREAESRKKFVMGNPEMTRLWNICPDNFESCKKDYRNFVPSLETYFTVAAEQVLGKVPTKEGEKLVNDGNFGWRALRLLASESPHFFTNSGNAIATLPEYLATMIEKVAKVLPLTVTEEPKEEEEMEDSVKVLEDSVKEGEVVEEEMEEENQREETEPLNADEMKKLAKALAAHKDSWKGISKKMGFEEDELEWFMQAKSPESGIEIMLQRWVEEEGDEANKAMLIYMLEGLELHSVVKEVYG